MRIKTIVVIGITILLTIVLMQNTEPVKFTILFGTVYMPKLVLLTGFSVVAFISGILVGRPEKSQYDIGAYHDSIHKKGNADTLSDEDRDYIG